ncbi:transglycosylase domain-containing protein [Candidatus Nesciobacter abundans]|nr:transglycosylase domain-containing protein [Candidatus Nesciobacter abundans]
MKKLLNFMLTSIITFCVIFFYINLTLPQINDLSILKIDPFVVIEDENKNLVSTYGSLKYQHLSINEIPKHIPHALISLEDRKFYSHIGIDFASIARALSKNLQSSRIVEGGSTITQQLAKNILQENLGGKIPPKSYFRKIREAFLSLKLEHKYSKDQILEYYLNRVYFGSGTYGIEAASWKYFGKTCKELSVSESAILISMLKSPSTYASKPEKLAERKEHVLNSMLKMGFINQEKMELALATPHKLKHTQSNSSIYFYSDWILTQIPTWIKEMKRNLKIICTIDLDLQNKADQASKEIIEKYKNKWDFENLALLAMSTKGHVKAIIGGSNYSSGAFNRATQSLRQSGSIFKFFVYSTALENNMGINTLIEDSPPQIMGWSPSNYYHQEKGYVTLAEGFFKSINSVTVRIAQKIGIKKILLKARDLGLNIDGAKNNLSISLGSLESTLLELVQCFGSVANLGHKVEYKGIVKIIDNDTNEVIWDPEEAYDMSFNDNEIYETEEYINESDKCKNELTEQVFEEKTNKKIFKLLYSVTQKGTARSIGALNFPVAGKTGSSQKYRDFWFVGFSPKIVLGTWCGNDNYSKPMRKNLGPNPAVMLCKTFLQKIKHDKTENEKWLKLFELNDKNKNESEEEILVD